MSFVDKLVCYVPSRSVASSIGYSGTVDWAANVFAGLVLAIGVILHTMEDTDCPVDNLSLRTS